MEIGELLNKRKELNKDYNKAVIYNICENKKYEKVSINPTNY